ncbi:DNA polymerase IV [Mycoplasma phocoeninasale]|uniref:Y-family DNA polymerase n=1 Tax=Mycoplasma phocoeninasale TaxID=2726117 RepID=UPI0019686401|nr:DNA polymerase IV [Mycoplasma phocoeninasale]
MSRIIFHIDMDTFFVSCERAIQPNLNDRPVVIADSHKRSIISAMSNEVKKLGFKVGDPFYLVKSKIDNVTVLKPNYQLYSLTSKRIFEYIAKNFTNKIEIYSIDECYIDCTELLANQNLTPLELASKIQRRLLADLKIPCSIGISYTKFLAKMSTNKAKPFGILETKYENIPEYFYPLSIEKIFGIGKKISKTLRTMNINTYEELINFQNDLALKKVFGKNYYLFIKTLKGENEGYDHVLSEKIKGISNSLTFMEVDSNDQDFLKGELFKLSYNIARRAQDKNLEGNVISLSIRDTKKVWKIKQHKIAFYSNDFDVIYKISCKLFDEFWDENWVRGLGIRISNLRSIFSAGDIDLFSSNNNSKIDNLIDYVNSSLGSKKLKTANQLLKENKIDINNIRFLRKNVFSKNDKINLEEKKTWK